MKSVSSAEGRLSRRLVVKRWRISEEEEGYDDEADADDDLLILPWNLLRMDLFSMYARW